MLLCSRKSREFSAKFFFGPIAVAVVLAAGCGSRDSSSSTGSDPAVNQPATAAAEPAAQPTANRSQGQDSPSTAAAEPSSDEIWDVIYMDDTRVGTTQTLEAQETHAGQRQIRTTSRMKMSLKRNAETIDAHQTTESLEDATTGDVLEFRSEITSGSSVIAIHGVRQADHWEIMTESAGRTARRTLPYDPAIRGFYALEQSLRQSPLKPAETRQLRMLLPGPAGVEVVDNTVEALDIEPTKLLAEARDLLRIRSTLTLKGQRIESYLWVDPAGQLLKTHVPSLGTTIYRVSRDGAQQAPSSGDFDLATATSVRLQRRLPAAHATERAVYRVRLKTGNPVEAFVSRGGQTVTPEDEHAARVTVQAVRPDRPATLRAEPPPTDADLAPNSLIQSDSPRILELAAQAAPNEADPWKIALALETHVKRLMRHVDFSTALASAAEVAESRSGDCTEHAMLLAALCRARRVPARVSTGLVYFANPAPGFAFHMWTEVWVNDRWVPIDATLAQGGIGAAHLKLADSNLASGNDLDIVLAVVPVIRQLEIEIVESE